jgi:hypothetical protein
MGGTGTTRAAIASRPWPRPQVAEPVSPWRSLPPNSGRCHGRAGKRLIKGHAISEQVPLADSYASPRSCLCHFSRGRTQMKRLFEFAAATSVRSPALATFGLLALAACSSERQMMEVDVADVPLAFRARLRRTP